MSDSQGQGSTTRIGHGDLAIVAALGLWSIITAVGPIEGIIGQVPLGLVAVLFAPGYALVAALFPRKRSAPGSFDTVLERVRDGGEVTLVERVVLALGLSVCIVPLLGLGLDYTAWGIHRGSFQTAIGSTTVLLAGIGLIRRLRVPSRVRFNPRIIAAIRYAAGRARNRVNNPRAGSTVTVLLVVGLVLAGTGIGFAALRVEPGEEFTEFYLVTEDQQTGEYVAGGYPDEIPPGEAGRVQVGIENQEGETLAYTVVVLLQSLGEDGSVTESSTLDTYTVRVRENETVVEPHTIRPDMEGTYLRVTYLLYRGSPPEDGELTPASAYRDAHLWIDVPSTTSG